MYNLPDQQTILISSPELQKTWRSNRNRKVISDLSYKQMFLEPELLWQANTLLGNFCIETICKERERTVVADSLPLWAAQSIHPYPPPPKKNKPTPADKTQVMGWGCPGEEEGSMLLSSPLFLEIVQLHWFSLSPLHYLVSLLPKSGTYNVVFYYFKLLKVFSSKN